MEKVTWRAKIKEGMTGEYIKRHDEIWPEMVAELKAAGICNYTIWLDGDLLFGYYECEKGMEYALEYQAKSAVVQRWEQSMKPVMTMFESKPRKVFDLK